MTTALEPQASRPAPRALPVANPVHTTLPLAGSYFAAAAVFLLAGSAGLVWIAPYLAGGQFLAPRVAGITHLFTLGWLTLVIFGAMAQIQPMALGAPIRSVRLARVAFWLLPPGIALFAYGVVTSSANATTVGVSAVALGIGFNIWNFGVSLSAARNRDVSWAGLVIGLGFLSLTLLLGMVLAHNLHYGGIAAYRVRVLAAHLHLAIVGWVLIVIVGMSNRMLPMFLIARGVKEAWSRRSVFLLTIGVPVLAAGLGFHSTALTPAGIVLVEAGVIAFAWQALNFYRHRTRRKLDPGMRFAAGGLAFLLMAAVLGPLAANAGVGDARLATAYVVAGLLGGCVLYVVGHFYKVVAMLAWTLRFAGQAGRGPVRTMGDLYSARLVNVQLACMATGVSVLLVGVLAASAAAASTGAAFFLTGTLIFMYQLARIRWVTPATNTQASRTA